MSNYYNRQWRLPNNENKDKQSNYSMDFDGASYIDLGNSSLGLTANTISIWFKTTSTTSGQQLLSKMGSTYQFQFRLETNGTISLYSFQDQSTFATLQSSTGYNDGNWHNVITTFNTTDGHKMYVDGNTTPVDTDTVNKSALQSSTERMLIGVRDSSTGVIDTARYFNGQIDGISIYNYALSSNQVTTLYGSSSTGIGNPMSLPAPVAYYPLGDQDAFNGSNYLVPNSSLKDYVFDFNAGSSQYISTTASISGFTSFTVSAWANAETLTTADTLVGQWRNGNTSNSAFLMYLVSNTMHFYIGSGSSAILAGGDTTLSTGQWYNFCATWDGTTTKLYINGVQESTTGSASSMNTTTVDLLIGAYNNSAGTGVETSKTWNGEISNVQVFNTALPATGSNSVETLYNNGSPLTSMSGYSSLVGWWKLDASATYNSSTTTWTIPDDSTNSNAGTSSGMTQSALQQSDLSFTSGYSPYAFDFDRPSGQYTSVGTVNLSSSWSVSIWLAWTDTIGSRVALNGSNGLLQYTPQTSSSGGLKMYPDDTTNNYFDVTPAINDGNWHNVVFSYDNSTTTLNTYTDGYLSDSRVNTAGATNIQFVGGATQSWFWNGKLSNCSVWNTNLSAAQVLEIYNEGVPSNLNNHSAYSNLTNWWQLGSNSSFNTNWTVLDEKGSNNGTSVNMTEDDIVDGVGSYANGLSSGMSDNIVGSAPFSDANSLSVNMDVLDRTDDTPA